MRSAAPLLLLAFVCLVPGARADEADRFADVTIETTVLADGLAMLTGAGGNLALAWGDDGAFLVDDQYAPLTERILAAVGALTDRPVRFVLNTHWHGDHTGGNEHLAAAGGLIFSHANVRRRLSTEQFTAFFDRTTPPTPAAGLPVVTFTDSLAFHLAGGEVRVFHVPHAHTDGDGVVHFVDQDVVHAGDVVFYGLYPYIDVAAGGTIDGLIAAARTIRGLCGERTRVIPGHGPLLTAVELDEYLAMLTGVRDAVAAAVADTGGDLAAVQAAQPAAPWDEAWGHTWLTSDQFVELVHASLDGPAAGGQD
jgi:glyoxylase-like metal-dependent hydrolase (beta-lactamase superfamily II)